MKLPNLLVSRAKDKILTGGPRSDGFVGISGRDLFLQVDIFPDCEPNTFTDDRSKQSGEDLLNDAFIQLFHYPR